MHRGRRRRLAAAGSPARMPPDPTAGTATAVMPAAGTGAASRPAVRCHLSLRRRFSAAPVPSAVPPGAGVLGLAGGFAAWPRAGRRGRRHGVGRSRPPGRSGRHRAPLAEPWPLAAAARRAGAARCRGGPARPPPPARPGAGDDASGGRTRCRRQSPPAAGSGRAETTGIANSDALPVAPPRPGQAELSAVGQPGMTSTLAVIGPSGNRPGDGGGDPDRVTGQDGRQLGRLARSRTGRTGR